MIRIVVMKGDDDYGVWTSDDDVLFKKVFSGSKNLCQVRREELEEEKETREEYEGVFG